VAKVSLNDSIPAEPHPTAVGDHDEDGVGDLMVKFPRSEVLGVLAGFGQVEVRVSGEVSGLAFAGADTVTVLYANLKIKMMASGDGGVREGVLSISSGSLPGASSSICFEVPEPGLVSISIYNVEGRLVRRLVDEPMEPDRYVVEWNGLDQSGARVAAGVYFLRLETENQVATGKAMIVR
jgi:hypothetical protein